jgi:hypothetical protein
MGILRVLAVCGLSLALAGSAGAACIDAACADQESLDSLRAEIAETCDCAAATSHKKYMKCVRSTIKDAVQGGTLPKACKKAVKRCESDSTCGRTGAVVCCEMNGGGMKARVVKKPEQCAATVCTAFPSTADACRSDATCAPLVRPFKTIQQVFTQSCALPTCHSAIAREGDLVLESEELSWESLVEKASVHEDAIAMDLMRVKSGDPDDSFLMRKLRGQGPGDSMPQGTPPLPDAVLDLIEDWIARGAHTTDEECPALADAGGSTAAAISQAVDVRVGRHSGGVHTVCDDDPIPGDFVWQPEPPLDPPPSDEGIQIYVPKKDIPSGTEWETCYAVQLDWSEVGANIGYAGGALAPIKQQIYRMHQGSHHLLVYAYYGPNPQGWKQNEFFPCFAANCLEENPNDCPPDANAYTLPIGGTQVAGTRYEVNYPEGVGLPILSRNTVIIANLHYTNPFQPAQDTYGEAWINMTFYKPGEFKALLDGIFAVNYADMLVEPYESKLMSRIWKPRSILTGASEDAAVFQLFGHMHKRGQLFDIDFVRDGACSESGALCGRDDDCACRPYQASCVPGQTCVRGPDAEDSRVYHTTKWNHAPVQDYPKPFFEVDHDQGLRWTCNIENGIEGDATRPPKRCHAGCNSCEWRAERGQCVFEREICLNYVNQACVTDEDCPAGRTCEDIDCSAPGGDPNTRRCARVYAEGEPIPLVFGELADDDMCNMFGYFVRQGDVPRLP